MNVSLFMNSCIQSLLCFRTFAALIKTSDHKKCNFHLTENTNYQGPVSLKLTYLLGSCYLRYLRFASRSVSYHSDGELPDTLPSLWCFAGSLHFYRQPRLCPAISGKRSDRESYLCHCCSWQKLFRLQMDGRISASNLLILFGMSSSLINLFDNIIVTESDDDEGENGLCGSDSLS